MPPPPTKLSPAELTKLEHAFATDPASDAYRPLAEAYLGLGRFMEAMVVCKKGMKTHPNAADPRVLLARVYAEQGRDKKALEELQGALQVAPSDKSALRMTGELQLKGGEAAQGKANLIKAFEVDPNDTDTQALMQQYSVEVPKAAPPAPVAPAHAPPVLQPSTNGATIDPAMLHSAPTRPGQPAATGSRPAVQPPPPPPPSGTRPAAANTGSRPAVRRPPPDPVSDFNEVPSEAYDTPRRRGGGFTKSLFFLLVIGVPLSLGGYYGYGQWKAKREREVRKLLGEAGDRLKNDTFDSYQKAAKAAEDALNLNPSSAQAAAYAGYAYAIRWGEHGGDDRTKASAAEYLEEARRSSNPISYSIAGDALFKLYSGKGAEGLKQLDEKVQDLEAKEQKSALLYLTQGLLQMNLGDLERARDSLEKAQLLASDDARVYVAMGQLQRRRGNDAEALKHFNTALKYTRKSHPEALLGTALIVLDQENPGPGYVAASEYLKQLLDSEPPPSPRQLAMAHMVRAFLISRVSRDIPLYTNKEFVKELEQKTGISADPAKAKAEIAKEEGQADVDKQNPELLIVRGKRLLYEENFNGAAEEIKKAIAMNGQRAHFHVELARVYLRKEGGEKDAEDALRKALTLVPDSPKLLTMLAQALARQKKFDDALAQYDRAVKDPKSKNGEARLAMARIYRDEKKDVSKAIENYERAGKEAIGDTMTIATAYDELGLLLDAKNDKAKARDAFEKALNAEKDYDAPYCHYVRFMKKANDPKDADLIKRLAGKYLELSPKGECAAELAPLK